jgi:5S rRNA maturation endonuclease (ribonuclease M5)
MNKSNRSQHKLDYESYTELESVLQEMEDFVDAVIVEGARDKEALEELGLTKEIVTCSSRPDTDFVDYLSRKYKSVTILTDYDRAGKRFNKRLTARLEHEGVRVEKRYRDEIGRILGFRGMRDIESVNGLKKRLL